MAAEHESWFDCWVGVVLPALRASLSVVWRLTTGKLGRACHLPYVDIDTFSESRPTLLSSQACAPYQILPVIRHRQTINWPTLRLRLTTLSPYLCHLNRLDEGDKKPSR